MNKKEFAVQEIIGAIGRIADLLNDDTIDREDKMEILEEVGCAIGELSSLGNGVGDELDVDFGLMKWQDYMTLAKYSQTPNIKI